MGVEVTGACPPDHTRVQILSTCLQEQKQTGGFREPFKSLSHFVTHQHKATPPEASSANQEL